MFSEQMLDGAARSSWLAWLQLVERSVSAPLYTRVGAAICPGKRSARVADVILMPIRSQQVLACDVLLWFVTFLRWTLYEIGTRRGWGKELAHYPCFWNNFCTAVSDCVDWQQYFELLFNLLPNFLGMYSFATYSFIHLFNIHLFFPWSDIVSNWLA